MVCVWGTCNGTIYPKISMDLLTPYTIGENLIAISITQSGSSLADEGDSNVLEQNSKLPRVTLWLTLQPGGNIVISCSISRVLRSVHPLSIIVSSSPSLHPFNCCPSFYPPVLVRNPPHFPSVQCPSILVWDPQLISFPLITDILQMTSVVEKNNSPDIAGDDLLLHQQYFILNSSENLVIQVLIVLFRLVHI